jgi:hypothetical protein
VAYGNIVLADHGLSTSESIPQAVPAPQLFYPRSTATDGSQQSAPVPIPVRYRPTIANSPITQAVPMVLAGSPATPEVVMLGGAGAISLTDANGIPCLTVQALNPSGWPALFGISVKANQSTPGNFDLYVVYNPNGAAAGTPPPPVLEEFFNLSLTATDPNFAASVINTSSKLIQVPSTYVPPATALSGFPATIAMLPASGALHLQDTSNPAVTYLTLQPSSPSQWLNSIGVLAQAAQQASTSCCATVKPEFSLLVVYNPLAAGVNVNLPVILEQLTPPSQPTLPGVFSPGSQLITLQTYSQAPGQSLSAYALMNYDPRKAVPEICLCGTLNGATSAWLPQQDLLGSNGSSQVFVVETESDGAAMLRFATAADPGSAEETNGLVPEEGTSFTANYRIGNGVSGNVGAESLIYVTTGDARIQSCSNPLPAGGGVDPETSDQIRRRAPQAFLAQERSVTMADYEATMESSAEVNQAVASLRWTGSWYSVFAAVEPAGGGNLSCALKKQLAASGESYRLAGQDLILESPQYVSLQVTLQIQVAPDYFQADVEHSLLQVLGSKNLPNGSKGLFSAGNFTFGQTVYLSPVYAAARSVPGVVLVTATQFQPQGVTTSKYLTAGEIKLGSLQIARLENDPSYPDHGQLTLLMQGGK